MENKKLNVGDILASKLVYGDEVLLYNYYKVVKVFGNGERVRLQKLEKNVRYECEAGGFIYPDYYRESMASAIPATDKTIIRSVKYHDGVPVVDTGDSSIAYGTWNGKPLMEYNRH